VICADHFVSPYSVQRCTSWLRSARSRFGIEFGPLISIIFSNIATKRLVVPLTAAMIVDHSAASGHVKAGAKLPSEAVLVKRFDTSRITVARALCELQSEGIVDRVAGSGSYVQLRESRQEGLVFGLLIPDQGKRKCWTPFAKALRMLRAGTMRCCGATQRRRRIQRTARAGTMRAVHPAQGLRRVLRAARV
jgi:DNA-binding transcriptional regulator YhcF (GntR family)